MRPLRLDLAGFTVFREPTTVDFTDVDFFALVGPTGAGKSTVLDAVCFALYGTVPRWSDKRAIANVLAPSGAEAKVRLVFESAGKRYAATRVVRRDGKGKVSTSHAGLEVLPPTFDLSTLDSGQAELGEPLAGTPGELDAAIVDVVGLPYEQFTSCVLLPQGAFAEFLHAKPAVRQQILVNLLGLSVYERIRDQATELAKQAETQVEALDRALDGMADVTDEAIAGAAERVEVTRRLATDVDGALPRLRALRQEREQAQRQLAELDAELERLRRVRIPAGLGTLTDAARDARDAALAAAQAVQAAEEEDDRLRAELATAGDPTALHRQLDEHATHDKLVAEVSQLAALVGEAQAEHERAATALDEATGAMVLARDGVERARAGVDAATTKDRAATLRVHLRVGEPCPVCEQPVENLPGEHAPELAAAKEALAAAQRRAEGAERAAATQEKVVRQLDRSLVAARTQLDTATGQRDELQRRLAGSPGVKALRAALATLAQRQRAVEEAAATVRAERERARRARTEAERAEQRIRAAWGDFDGVRDAVAPLGPPPAQREDLARAWQELAEWASAETGTRDGQRTEMTGRVASAVAEAGAAAQQLAGLFTAADLAVPAGLRDPGALDPEAAVSAAAVAVERAVAAHERLLDRRDQAEKLAEQRAGYEREGQVARTLATHLRANNFERWLLTEALDLLVSGGSRILRELSGGQYELVARSSEFFVVDHHDAGLARPVRTLSGGETFQASLALALALAEQLSGMAGGVASLESILLDEGFGTLDAATLDSVAATLENLAARGDRMVGVVTHVGSLAERIPVRFEIHKDARTARVERVGR
jgi:DNA repair protein SbcC/Rad50